MINLNGDDGKLIEPEWYYTIKQPENRLFAPVEYLPLFLRAGWSGGAL